MKYLFLVLVAIVAGLFAPSLSSVFGSIASWLLAGIFFFSALHLDTAQQSSLVLKLRSVLLVNVLMLVLFPIVVYLVAQVLVPTMSLTLLLLAAMPAGMTAPFLTKLIGGREDYALVLTISTSLLAPITVPVVIKLLTGSIVAVSFMEMFSSLALVIFLPFALAQFVKKFFPRQLWRERRWHAIVSTILLLMIIAGIVAGQADYILGGLLTGQTVKQLLVLVVFFAVLHLVGYWALGVRKRGERLATTVCLTYMNFTLAIVIANQFFGDPKVVVPVVLSVLPWAILLPIFKRLVTRAL